MRKSCLILLIILTLGGYILTTQPLAEAGSQWSIFLHSQASNEIVRVNQDGTQQIYNLGLSPNDFIANQIAVSLDGRLVAYCLIKPASDTPNQTTSTTVAVVVRDLENGTNIAELALGESDGCRLAAEGFSEDGHYVALGLVSPFINPNPDEPVWRLIVIDTQTGQIAYELNANSSELLGTNMDVDNSYMPEVRYFANNQIIFAQLLWRTGGAPLLNTFLFSLDTLQIQPIENWGTIARDYLSTGELIWIDTDPSLPTNDPGGPLPASNVVKLADKSGESRIIYHDPESIIINAVFINEGNQIAINTLAPFDPNATGQPVKWIALDRSGNVTELHREIFNFTQIVDAPEGYALFTIDYETAEPASQLEYYANGQATLLWEAGGFWSVVGTTYLQPNSDLQPFPTFSQ